MNVDDLAIGQAWQPRLWRPRQLGRVTLAADLSNISASANEVPPSGELKFDVSEATWPIQEQHKLLRQAHLEHGQVEAAAHYDSSPTMDVACHDEEGTCDVASSEPPRKKASAVRSRLEPMQRFAEETFAANFRVWAQRGNQDQAAIGGWHIAGAAYRFPSAVKCAVSAPSSVRRRLSPSRSFVRWALHLEWTVTGFRPLPLWAAPAT